MCELRSEVVRKKNWMFDSTLQITMFLIEIVELKIMEKERGIIVGQHFLHKCDCLVYSGNDVH